jgi:D-glycero-D-manno-heptose 1,7-bisphosphate phosphatase
VRDWPPDVRPKYEWAVFLDRDGTITVDTHYPHRVDDLTFIPGSLAALKRLAALPAHIIVVSNQAGIALGMFRREDMSRYNAELRARVEQSGGRIDAFYFCPHREPKDLPPGEKPCPCAKPAPGMLLEAARDFGIDLRRSFMIGDKASDVAAGNAAGSRSILVSTGKAGAGEVESGKVSPDLTVDDLNGAALAVERIVSSDELSSSA